MNSVIFIRIFSLVFAMIFLYCTKGYSQGSARDFLDEDTLAEIKVATRIPEKAANLPYSISTINQKQIAQSLPRTIPEALNFNSGVFLQKTNHGGGSPFLRGLTGNQVLTMLDGIRLNNATFRYGPNQYLNTVDIFTLQNVEIVRGSGSVQYGSDALGGVVYLQTKDPLFAMDKNKWTGNFTGRYITQNMEKTARAEMAYGAKKTAILAGYSYRDFGDLYGGDTTGKQSPSGYREDAFNVKMLFALPADWQLKLSHQSLLQKHVPVYHKIVLENYLLNKMHPQNKHVSYANLSKSFSNRYLRRINFTLSHQQSLETRISQKNQSTTHTEETDKVHTLGATVELFHQFNTYWSANSGAEFYFDKIRSSKATTNLQTGNIVDGRGLYPDNASYKNLSVYSLHQYNIRKWFLTAGLRYNKNFALITDENLGKIKVNPQALVANVGALFKALQYTSVYANFSSGYRAPNIDDMGTLGIVDFRYEQPAYDLKPEYNYNYEAGIKHQTNKVSVQAAAYYSTLKNLITRAQMKGQQIDGYNVYKKENAESGYIKGVELFANYLPLENLQIAAQLAYQQGWNNTKDEPLRRVPPLFGSVSANYSVNKFFVKAEILAADKQSKLAQGDKDDNRIPAGGTPGWSVINFYAGYHFNKHFSVNTSLQNILNKDYRLHGSGINGAGRSMIVSLKASI